MSAIMPQLEQNYYQNTSQYIEVYVEVLYWEFLCKYM